MNLQAIMQKQLGCRQKQLWMVNFSSGTYLSQLPPMSIVRN